MSIAAEVRALLDRQSEQIDRLDAQETRAIARAYEAARVELSDVLVRMEDQGADTSTPWEYQRYQATMVQIQFGLVKMREKIGRTIIDATQAQGEQSIQHMIEVLSRAEQQFTGAASAIQISSMQRLAKVQGLLLHAHSLDRYTLQTVEEIQRELLVGMARKESYRDLRRRLFGVHNRNAYESMWLAREPRLKLIVQMERAKASDEVHRAGLGEASKILDPEPTDDPLMARADEFRDKRNHPLSRALDGRLRLLSEDWVVPRAEVALWAAVTKHGGSPSSIMWPLVGVSYRGRTYPAHYGDRGRQTAWRQSWGSSGQRTAPKPTTST